MPLDTHRVICSTITLRHLSLSEALSTIADLGFSRIDLGALPGVCDHVPYELGAAAVDDVASTVKDSGLGVVSVNGDVGSLNAVLDQRVARERRDHLDRLLDLTAAIGAQALVLPNGHSSHEPVTDLAGDLSRSAAALATAAELAASRGLQVWVEAPHHFRLAHDLERAGSLLDLVPAEVGVVCDVSHITAAGATPRQFLQRHGHRTRHVHLRDAEPGYIHHSIGNGVVDFADLVAVLDEIGYDGALALELETRDVADADRPAAALAAGELISDLLAAAGSCPRPGVTPEVSMSTSQPTPRTAIVTGAGSPRGIGRATALRLATDGWAVAVLDLDGDLALEAAQEVATATGAQVRGYQVDVADEASVEKAVGAVEADLPVAAGLANIAGITSPTRFFDTTLAEWNRIMSVNATGTYLVTRQVAAGMRDRGYGRIVTMSSVSAIRGGGVFGGVPYSAAKAALLGFTRALARELGPSGVTVNAVTPGVVATDIRAAATSPQLEASLAADVPLGRQATAAEVAALIAFLLGEDAGYITGATYDINGGSHIS